MCILFEFHFIWSGQVNRTKCRNKKMNINENYMNSFYVHNVHFFLPPSVLFKRFDSLEYEHSRFSQWIYNVWRCVRACVCVFASAHTVCAYYNAIMKRGRKWAKRWDEKKRALIKCCVRKSYSVEESPKNPIGLLLHSYTVIVTIFKYCVACEMFSNPLLSISSFFASTNQQFNCLASSHNHLACDWNRCFVENKKNRCNACCFDSSLFFVLFSMFSFRIYFFFVLFFARHSRLPYYCYKSVKINKSAHWCMPTRCTGSGHCESSWRSNVV